MSRWSAGEAIVETSLRQARLQAVIGTQANGVCPWMAKARRALATTEHDVTAGACAG